jgi:phage replication-related protein YjqB (UPF0714/DUF867 family)
VRRRAHSVAHCTADPPRHGSFDRWHITSTDIHEASFPRLNSVLSRGFTYAVAFHGFDDPEILIDILIGGAAPYSLKQEIETAIKGAIAGSDITVRIASPDEKFGGDSLDNMSIVSPPAERTAIQIEQSSRARASHWREIANAVANVYNTKLG